MNDRQREAIFWTEGPLLVLAGAGSGKTTVLVNRIANLIRYGSAYHSEEADRLTAEDAANMRAYLAIGTELSPETQREMAVSPCEPWQIMAITFTNKAAGELKKRLTDLLGESGGEIWASTFHSACARSVSYTHLYSARGACRSNFLACSLLCFILAKRNLSFWGVASVFTSVYFPVSTSPAFQETKDVIPKKTRIAFRHLSDPSIFVQLYRSEKIGQTNPD